MDRISSRYRYLFVLPVLAAVVFSAGGCRSLAILAAYLIKGTDVEADYRGLEGKKVAVVCRAGTGLTFGNPTVASDLARQVSLLLTTNGHKIKVVDHQKVSQWTDANEWTEFPEVGKALGAEMVVGIDLAEFSLYQGQTLYQGKANATISVYDCANGNKVVFEKSLPQVLYPPNTGIPTSDQPKVQFRRRFIRVLADQIARHFYPHDPHADLGLDSDAL
jgi:hypothetical protein